ncbi:MAG TPA: glycosyltransferase family 1 protein [Candidatus Hydrogenedentes bacterium]|nr:glycosyltransferase family 1 protein [Candidatus Hydrogenedentota bacterium]
MLPMARVIKYTVIPKIPERLGRLSDIANNLWWSWDPDAVELFFRMDRDLWIETGQNPRRLLGELSQERLEELAVSGSFLAHLERVASRLDAYMADGEWLSRHNNAPDDLLIAYLSAEFGIQESINIYSGGLGVLAGDHLKAASDLGVPLVGLGLLYREGYFRQYMNADGWQQEMYPKNDFHNMPIVMMRDDAGAPIEIEVPYPGRHVKAYVWRCQVGRIALYLLDCDHEANTLSDRSITGQLYGGDRETRIKQEIMLGMGGVIALKALGLHPTVYHINEGHAAFMMLERIKNLIDRDGITFNEAVEVVKVGSVFTTHTPVPAGNDMFDPAMIATYFKEYCEALGISVTELLALGRQDPSDTREPFCMTVLALKLSSASNGVSKLHGTVARNMWSRIWKGAPEDELPITSVTNGVHIPSWISRDLAGLFDRYLGPDWVATPHDQSVWERIDAVPDTELFRTHSRRRERLVNFARRRLVQQLTNRGTPGSEVRSAGELLDSEVLTIGFARRFATYKRGTLLFKNPERLRKILLNPEMPVQLIIAGKAHPQDTQSKELIREIIHFAHEPVLRNHIVFIEDYDINVARYMLQGVDCWLNTPRRPMEASGTSGMKAAANGALNISIPDGWWCEAEGLGENGWSIGKGESYDNTEEQDQIESEALYEIIENEVAPMFYNRGRDGLPREWIARMKTAIRTIAPMFNTYRMVLEYADRFYVPCCVRRHRLFENNRAPVYKLAEWKSWIRAHWAEVRVLNVESGRKENLQVGDSVEIVADVQLGQLQKDDVKVEIFHGGLDTLGQLPSGNRTLMDCIEEKEKGIYRFKGYAPCDHTGQIGCTIRILPSHPHLGHEHEMGLIAWA